MINELRTDYEQRLSELEQRLEAAEPAAAAGEPQQAQPAAAPVGGSVTAGNAFNPQISVILDGNYYRDDINGDGNAVVGEAAQPSGPSHGDNGHEHGAAVSNGFNMRDMEEAWFATRNLPAGLRLKAGKFLSDVGYLNNRHPHQWDFADQGIAYENLLGEHGLQDTGVQLTWLPQLPFYALFGAEQLQGDQERLGAFIEEDDEPEELSLGDQKDGGRLYTLFAKLSPDLGYDHALQVGASYMYSRQHQEIHEDPLFETGLEGDAGLWAIDLVSKCDNPRAYGHRDFNVQAEYLRSIKDVVVRAGDPAEIERRLPDWQARLRDALAAGAQ